MSKFSAKLLQINNTFWSVSSTISALLFMVIVFIGEKTVALNIAEWTGTSKGPLFYGEIVELIKMTCFFNYVLMVANNIYIRDLDLEHSKIQGQKVQAFNITTMQLISIFLASIFTKIILIVQAIPAYIKYVKYNDMMIGSSQIEQTVHNLIKYAPYILISIELYFIVVFFLKFDESSYLIEK